MNKQYVTTIEINIIWTDPANGKYHPTIEIRGDIPDDFPTVNVIKYMMDQTYYIMEHPV